MGEKEKYQETDELLVTYLTGMAGEAEREAAIAWIHESAENKRYFDELKEIYKASKLADPSVKTDTALSWERIKARHYKELNDLVIGENHQNRFSFIRETLKYAALIALALSIGYFATRNYSCGRLL